MNILDMDESWPLFPIKLYIFNSDGTYGQPIEINSDAQLQGVGTQFVVRFAVENGQEVIMTDPMDITVFHAKDGKILFPPQDPQHAKQRIV
jgi:hypothetical protein